MPECGCRPIPGPDPGACPECGGWVRAGVYHDCAAEAKRVEDQVNRLVAAYLATEAGDQDVAS